MTGVSLLILFCPFFLCAQHPVGSKIKITGRIVDSLSRSYISFASVTAYQEKNARPLKGGSSGNNGSFTLDGLTPGSYTLKIDVIGYQARSLGPLRISGKSAVFSIGDILLQKKSESLQAVTVTATRGLVENKIDKLVYNAEKDVSSQGGMATDVLKKVPMVSVDVDGNVQLLGNSNILFLINGKPSSIFGSSLSDALQSIPASQIKNIEVITSPGSKYDAEGTGGIINIVLKDNKLRGINGNLSLTAGSRLENGSLNLNARHGSFGMNAYFSSNAQVPSTTRSHSDRNSVDSADNSKSLLSQDGSSRFRRGGYQAGLGFDWSIDKKNSVSGNISFNHFGYRSTGIVNEEQAEFTQPSGNTLSDLLSLVNTQNRFQFHSIDWSVGYKKTFAQEDRELDIYYNASNGNSASAYTQEQSLPTGDSLFQGSNSNNEGKDHASHFNIDYTQPFSEKVKLETGARVSIRNISSTSDVFSLNPALSSYLYDTAQSNSLTYTRDVYAGYASLLFPIYKILNVKAGLRYERTETEAGFSKVGGTVIPGYNTFAPSVILSHRFENEQTLKISYSKRIHRPDYHSLNPFVNASDPKNLSQGNPYLQPQIANNIDLSYSKSFEKGSALNVILFYHRSDHDIQPFIVYYPSYQLGDSTYTDVSVNTPMNVGSENNYGTNIYGSVPVNSKLNLRTNISIFDRYINTGDLGGDAISSFNYRFNLNADYQLNKTLVFEFYGNFNSARNEIQGRYPSWTSYNFAFRKQVWNKKGSFAFTTTNPFANYVNQATSVSGQDFTLNSLRRIPYRSFGINFTYKFGKLEFKKEKEEKDKEFSNPSDTN
ncbi:MAG: TonB-dependent receptor [Bacteroidota bacterium]|nr:TonB-dependent receptor [Bacteroidota bacterium]